MPLYEYQCESCQHRFERIQKFSDPPVETCPSCGGPVKKLFSSPAIQFKGSGWYITDYAKKPAGDSKSGASKDAASSSSSSGDSAGGGMSSSAPKETRETKETKETKDTSSSAAKKD
jgi:putative FmdB family regulatory protein